MPYAPPAGTVPQATPATPDTQQNLLSYFLDRNLPNQQAFQSIVNTLFALFGQIAGEAAELAIIAHAMPKAFIDVTIPAGGSWITRAYTINRQLNINSVQLTAAGTVYSVTVNFNNAGSALFPDANYLAITNAYVYYTTGSGDAVPANPANPPPANANVTLILTQYSDHCVFSPIPPQYAGGANPVRIVAIFY